jgi:hypothetical protein
MSALPREVAGLRPDLHGVEVELDHENCPALAVGQRASMRIGKVSPAGEDDPDLVLAVGDWFGPDGDEVGVQVLVHVSVLPPPGTPAGPVAGPDEVGQR